MVRRGVGGFASMLVALPSSIAFGIAVYAVLGPEYVADGVIAGILGAVVMGILAPLFGENAPLAAALRERWTALGAVSFSDLASLLMPAVTLSVLLSIDTLKTCVVMDSMTRRRHNSNRELIGQGVANFMSALAGGMPGAGTMGASLVNVSGGGKTRLSGVLEGVFVIVAFAGFAWLISWLPIAALAGILMVVAWRMFDRSSFLLLRQKTTVFDFLVIAAVVATAIGVNLIAAAGVGLLLATLLFIRGNCSGRFLT
ncbi:MAG: hypothetical protein KJ936_09070 [Proteobacteria bacterium]|nr:hypothetical protein [Pseudomonadota bacterium]